MRVSAYYSVAPATNATLAVAFVLGAASVARIEVSFFKMEPLGTVAIIQIVE